MKTKLILLSMLLGSAVGQSQTPIRVKDIHKAFSIYCATLRSAIEYESKHPDDPNNNAIALRDEAYSPQGDACTGEPGFEPIKKLPDKSKPRPKVK